MSIHKSLKSKGKLRRHRNVLTRTEQLDTLKEDERWQDGDSVYGLPKVRVFRTKRKKAKKEETVDETAEGVAVEGADGEAGAPAGAAPGEGSGKES